MTMKKKVLLVGCNPEVVDFSKWPGLNAKKLLHVLSADCESLNALGRKANQCFIDDDLSGTNDVKEALKSKDYDCVLVGAGVQKVDEHCLVSESLVTSVHKFAPAAKICFNSGSTNSVDAVKRRV